MNVLWISRHQMTPNQFRDLERALGGVVTLRQWADTVECAEALLPALSEADAVAAVLPMELLSETVRLAGEKPVLVAASARRATGRTLTLPDGRQEAEYAFVHAGWNRILRLELTLCRV